MPDSIFDGAVPEHARPRPADASLGLLMVVGTSRVNHIVVGKIAERAGLKVLAETPDGAGSMLVSHRPGTVVLDGGADNSDCDIVMETLAAQRLASDGRLPIVILLSNTNATDVESLHGDTIDAVVMKPINPDRLQPLLQELVDQRR